MVSFDNSCKRSFPSIETGYLTLKEIFYNAVSHTDIAVSENYLLLVRNCINSLPQYPTSNE